MSNRLYQGSKNTTNRFLKRAVLGILRSKPDTDTLPREHQEFTQPNPLRHAWSPALSTLSNLASVKDPLKL